MSSVTKFQQRHYVAIAEVLRDYPDVRARQEITYKLASMFRNDNPKFKWDIFAKAAGVDPYRKEVE